MASTSETGLQLFARLVPRPSMDGLDDVLFPDGPSPKDVIELSGEPSTGKTLLFTQFIAKCILPKEFKAVGVGGLKAGVVLLNTDHHFQMSRLVSILKSHLKGFSVADVEEVVQDSLNRLVVYNISGSEQLQVTFHAVQSLVSNQPDIGLVLLDSVCAFYWMDTMTSATRKMDLYVKTVVRSLQNILGDFKGVLMYSRPAYFQSKSGHHSDGFTSRRVVLKRDPKNTVLFCAEVDSPNGRFSRKFNIDSAGVHWLR